MNTCVCISIVYTHYVFIYSACVSSFYIYVHINTTSTLAQQKPNRIVFENAILPIVKFLYITNFYLFNFFFFFYCSLFLSWYLCICLSLSRSLHIYVFWYLLEENCMFAQHRTHNRSQSKSKTIHTFILIRY